MYRNGPADAEQAGDVVPGVMLVACGDDGLRDAGLGLGDEVDQGLDGGAGVADGARPGLDEGRDGVGEDRPGRVEKP